MSINERSPSASKKIIFIVAFVLCALCAVWYLFVYRRQTVPVDLRQIVLVGAFETTDRAITETDLMQQISSQNLAGTVMGFGGISEVKGRGYDVERLKTIAADTLRRHHVKWLYLRGEPPTPEWEQITAAEGS